MSDVMAIVSKAVFEELVGKTPALGTVAAMQRYVSANKGLTPLTGGGTLYLVTVRPPDEALWLVAVLENPVFSGTQWDAPASRLPLTDISALKSQLVFENGKGLPREKGKLGMSLQTPRVLAASDLALLAPYRSSAESPPPTAPPIEPVAALVAAVIATPDDDAPKRALAAYWTSIGEPRGALVTTDLALRGKLSVSRRKELTAARATLLAANARRWWPWDVTTRQRGGFLTAVSAEVGALRAHATSMFAVEPITSLEVFADEASLGPLLRAPWLARLRSLAVRGEIGDEAFAELVACKHLASLVQLNVGNTGLSALPLGSKLPHLRSLVLTNNPLGDEGVQGLLDWKHLEQLRALYLTGTGITGESLGALVRSGRLANLEKITLGSNEALDDEGVLALTQTPMPKLAYVELGNLDLSRAALAPFDRTRFPSLRHFDR